MKKREDEWGTWFVWRLTPTFDRPRITTSGDSAGGSCEYLPTVKRRIGAGEKSFEEMWICF